MATRVNFETRGRRAPLKDTTDRSVNSSPVRQREHGHDKPNFRPNPLGANPTSGPPIQVPIRKYNAPSSYNMAIKAEISDQDKENYGVAPVQRKAVPDTNDPGEDRRISQYSTSSGASGNQKTHIGPWQLGKTLGQGSAARVRLARHRVTQDVVAIKILAKNQTQLTAAGSMAELDKWDRNRDEFTAMRHMPLSIEREVAMLKLIDHPNIVRLHDIWENRSEIYLVLEYMDGGDLFTYINNCGPLPEFEMMNYFRQILSALGFIHSFNIFHRDLKPENILMRSSGVVKIADFGMAAIQQSPTHALKTSCGSPHYAAPELIARHRYQGNKVDVWSLGCILYAALCKRLPFDDLNGDIPRLLAKASKGVYAVPNFLGKDAQDLIAKMLTVEPAKRISVPKIWQHPLVQRYEQMDRLKPAGSAPNVRPSDRCKPVPAEELDVKILRQLKSMWHTFSEKQIAMQLTSTQPNDQKLFYWLLLAHRERELENYDTDLVCSPSDFHHLHPVTWKRKITTAEFPSRYRRTPSRFTVISTVPTSRSIELPNNTTDGGATVQSYDPYKSSRIIENTHASHAKIVVYRNGSTANNSTRASTLRRTRNGSLRSASTHSRLAKGGHRNANPSLARASQRSLSSIPSNESVPYIRPASRHHKRAVNFSRAQRQQANQREAEQKSHGVSSGRKESHSYATGSVPVAQATRGTNEKKQENTQCDGKAPQANRSSALWQDDVRKFSKSIAKDCDEAFNSSLLCEDSYFDASSNVLPASRDRASPSFQLMTPTSNVARNSTDTYTNVRPWQNRPLPPTPQSDDSDRADTVTLEELDRRIVSAPIYSQYSTQWGKHRFTNEGQEHEACDDSDKKRVVSAPAKYAKEHSMRMDDNMGLEYLCKQDNTIRVVNSPSGHVGTKTRAPRQVDSHEQKARARYTHPGRQESNLRQQYVDEDALSSFPATRKAPNDDVANLATTLRIPSWFKRAKDKENAFDATAGSNPRHADEGIAPMSSESSGDSALPPARKKSFNLAFWRHTKPQENRMSLIEPGDEKEHNSQQASHVSRHKSRSTVDNIWNDESPSRNIEPQQTWLARLFRVKPVMKYLCFCTSRRRARQAMVTVLKDWHQYGIRDVQVDKKRSIVFARVASENYLQMKEVSFAIEIMTVIEHGRSKQLSIARFTQERGAASSFTQVVNTMTTVFSSRNMLVTEKRKAKMMIKTLNS